MNVHRQIETLQAQHASEWVEVLRKPTAKQRAEFVVWLKESPRNVHDFLSMYALDQALSEFDAERHHDIESLVAQADRRIVHVADRFKRVALPKMQHRNWRSVALAAGLALVTFVSFFLISSGQGWQEFQTIAGEQRAFELEDGSVMYLNTRSRVAMRFSKQVRDVRLLEGEALFKVHHDPNAPFRVHTDTTMIQAVGTQFNVYARPELTEVAVIEGLVKVSPEIKGGILSDDKQPADMTPADSTSFNLAASEVAQINQSGTVSVRKDAEINDTIAWRERRLIFREDSLAHIVEEFNRYNNRQQIHLDSMAIATRAYTGVFDADDPESFVEVLAHDPDLAIEQSGQNIVIRAR